MFNQKIKYEVKIEGMKCEHCASHVKEELSKIPDVKKVEVSLKDNMATLTCKSKIDTNLINEKITSLEYSVLSINEI